MKNDLAFCKEYKSDESLYYSDYTRHSEPVASAQENYNACVEIFNRGKVLITHESTPKSVAISLRRTDTQTKFSIQGVESGAFSCRALPSNKGKLTPDSVVEVTENMTVLCTRAAVKRGEDLYYPNDAIQVGTSQGVSYVVEVNEETIYGPAKQSATKQLLAALERQSARVPLLEKEIASGKIELHPFFVTSGPKGLDGSVGPKWAWGEVVGKPQKDFSAFTVVMRDTHETSRSRPRT